MLNQSNKTLKVDIGVIEKSRQIFKLSVLVLFGAIGLCYIPSSNKIISTPIKAETLYTSNKKSFVTEALGRSGPAVVKLETQRKVFFQGNSNLPSELLIDPYLQRFFGIQGLKQPYSRIERGQGSGVIFSPNGLVLTNAHVVEKTDRLMIVMSDGRKVPGRVIGQDALTDLAVIQLEGSGPWPSAPLGNSDKLEVGDWAIAVGNPFGLQNTVTLGIISNLNRNVSQLGISGKRLELIQTDAAINPGNSGGPLLNAKGEVVGINTLVRSGPGAGLGFAIPINLAREIANQLVNKGSVSHPMIGVSLSSIENSNQDGYTYKKPGAIVRYVIPGAPADIAGLKVNDVIVSIKGKLINAPEDVIAAINKNGTKASLIFKVKRGAKLFKVSITPIEMSEIRNL